MEHEVWIDVVVFEVEEALCAGCVEKCLLGGGVILGEEGEVDGCEVGG